MEHLYNYAQQLNSDLQAYLDETKNNPIQAFTKLVLEEMAEKANLDTYDECYVEIRNNSDQLLGQINGYAISENKETDTISVTLFFTYYESIGDKLPNISLEKFNDALQKMYRYYNDASKGYRQDAEPSREESTICNILFKDYNRISTVRFCVISNGRIPNTKVKKERKDSVLFKYLAWDINSLYMNLHSASDHEPINVDFEEDYDYTIPFIEMKQPQHDYKCLLIMLPGKFLYDIYEENGTNLMQNNVRYFLGFKKAKKPNDPNGGMLTTLRTEPYMFLAYNNGLTCTAQDVQCKYSGENIGTISSISDFQIINGGQTTASIFNAKRLHDDIDLSDVYVQVKLIVLTANNETVLPLVSRYSNSQNPVKASDITVNNAYNVQLQKLSRTIYAPDKNGNNDLTIWFYERMRGQYDIEKGKMDKKIFDKVYPSSQRFKKELLAKVRQAWDEIPYKVVEGDAKNYKDFIPKVEKYVPDRVYYEDSIALIILFNALNTSPVFKGFHQVKAVVLAYTISLLAFLTQHKLSLLKIWKSQQVQPELLHFCEELGQAFYEFIISIIPPTSTFRDFTKNEDMWERVKNHGFDISIDTISACMKDPDEDEYRAKKDEVTEDDFNLVVSMGTKFWDGIMPYNECFELAERIYKKGECDTAKEVYSCITHRKFLSEKLIAKAKAIVEKTRENNIEIAEVKSYSTFAKDDITESNLFTLYQRISRVTAKDWDTIINLLDHVNIPDSKRTAKINRIRNAKKKEELSVELVEYICTDVLDEVHRRFNLNF